MKANKRLLNKTGFSLVEVVVSVFLLCILIIPAYLVLFTSSFDGVYSAGRKSGTIFEAQEVIENAINNPGYTDNTLNKQADYTIIITGDDIATISVKGNKLDVDKDYTGVNGNIYDVSVSTFVP